MTDAESNSAPIIAETIGVSQGTVRNRIDSLEEDGIIEGYRAHVNFERAGRRLATLFLCNVPVAERQSAARVVNTIPGVVNVRILMDGRRNFHSLAVSRDPDDLRRIGTTLSEGGIEIEDEMILKHEDVRAYEPFGSEDTVREETIPDFVSCESEVVEVTVESEAPIAKMDVSEAVGGGILDEEPLVVSIRQDNERLTPHGDTTLQLDDLVTVFSCGGVTDATCRAFSGSSDEGP